MLTSIPRVINRLFSFVEHMNILMKELENHLLVGTRPTNLAKMPPTFYSTGPQVAKKFFDRTTDDQQ